MADTPITRDCPAVELIEPPAAALEPGARFGRYVVLEKLGAGGMGVVLTAYDPQLDRRVALKVLPPRATRSELGKDRLLREAQAMARLSHPNVVAIHDVGEVDGQVFLAMDFVDGSNVRAWLNESRDWRDIVGVFMQAGHGLAAAHDAGLIHRDFKPDNLLIAETGFVYVTDFGLARPGDDWVDTAPQLPDTDETTPTHHAFGTPLTRTGALLGTPAYMAPEQHRAGVIDSRADQFGFCASLYEALYDQRPFPKDPSELVEAITQGEVREPPKDSPVPSWLQRIVLRGLRPDPEHRYPSMHELLDELDQGPRRRRRIWTAAALAVLTISAGVAIYAGAVGTDEREAICTGAEDDLAGIWDDPTKAAAHDAFTSLSIAYAPDTWSRVEETVDQYASAWIEMRTDACLAARVRGHETLRQLELRTVCLDGRRKHLRALSKQLVAADATTVSKAASAAHSLPLLEPCADLEGLSQAVQQPDDPTLREVVDELRTQLAETKVLQETGKVKQAQELARSIVAKTDEINYLPVRAEALFQLSFVEFSGGNSTGAEKTLYDALDAAEASGHDVIAAESWSLLVFVVGNLAARYDEAEQLARRAEAAVTRLGGTPEIRARLHNVLGAIAHRRADYDNALRLYRSAITQFEETIGPNHPKLAMVVNNVGIVLLKRGDVDGALAHQRRALAIKEVALGPGHPSVAFSRLNLAQALSERSGHEAEAIEHARAALSIWKDTIGLEHPNAALGRSILGEALRRNGELDAAYDEHARALEVLTAKLGNDSVHLSYALVGQGKVLLARGRHAEAIAPLERAVTLREAASGDLWERGDARFALVRALDGAGRQRARARLLVDQVRADYGAAGPRGQRSLAELEDYLDR